MSKAKVSPNQNMTPVKKTPILEKKPEGQEGPQSHRLSKERVTEKHGATPYDDIINI